jgi:hypothetical protein
MTVAICSLNQVPTTIIEQAKVETTYVFRSMEVEIRWKDCDGNLFTEDGGYSLTSLFAYTQAGTSPR